jgi:glucuronoarabinoxylan endo-1,4-beta-xylanase
MKLLTTFIAALLMLSFGARYTGAQSATIYWNKTEQVIDGFGASDAAENRAMTSDEATLFFSPTAGIGLSLLRTGVPNDGSCTTINPKCAGEVSDMQLAIANGARVWSTPWSPPAAMKSNNNLDDGGTLLAASYGSYATYLANYVKSLSTLYGINLYALSVQNEPEKAVPYPSALWSGTAFNSFVGTQLGPTFAAEGLTPLIALTETSTSQDLPAYTNPSMNGAAAPYVGIIATHDYSHVGAPAYPLGQSAGKHLWETEVCDKDAFDPSIVSALKYAVYIHQWMTLANANAWHYWWLIGLNAADNQGLVNSSGTVTKRLYMMGNYSKFVRPGFYRIDATATPQKGVFVSAYKNSSSGALVIVAINQNTSNVSQSFSLSGTSVASVTPWTTSDTLNLAEQSDLSVSGGTTFTYTLPGSSITTFTGSAARPSDLRAKVQ